MSRKWDAIRGSAEFYVTMAVCLVVIAVSGYFLLFGGDRNVIKSHFFQDIPQILRGRIRGGFADIGADLGGRAAEEAEAFFDGQFEDFEFGFMGFHAQGAASGVKRGFDGIAGANSFL